MNRVCTECGVKVGEKHKRKPNVSLHWLRKEDKTKDKPLETCPAQIGMGGGMLAKR